MSYRADVITREIKKYDYLLYCEKNRDGKLCVYRKGRRIESYDLNGTTLHAVLDDPYFVIALTDTWNLNGEPRDWGIIPILGRLQMIDCWNRDLAKESVESIEKHDESKDRAIDNHIESFLKDKRREFAAITNDINTSTLNKKIN